MVQLIDKAALVAEIQGYISGYKDILSKVDKKCLEYAEGIEAKIDILQHLLSFLNTLEVKDVGVDLGDPNGDKSAKYIVDTDTLEMKEIDLEKEIEDYFKGWSEDTHNGVACHYQYVDLQDCKSIAKHFFELGLNAQGDSHKYLFQDGNIIETTWKGR